MERRYCGVPLGVESAWGPSVIRALATGVQSADARAKHGGMKWLIAGVAAVLGLATELVVPIASRDPARGDYPNSAKGR